MDLKSIIGSGSDKVLTVEAISKNGKFLKLANGRTTSVQHITNLVEKGEAEIGDDNTITLADGLRRVEPQKPSVPGLIFWTSKEVTEVNVEWE